MKVHAFTTSEHVDTASGGPERSFQGPWLPVKLEASKAAGIAVFGTSFSPHQTTGLDEKRGRNIEQQDAVFLGGILSFYNKTRDGSVVLSRARIKGININTWA